MSTEDKRNNNKNTTLYKRKLLSYTLKVVFVVHLFILYQTYSPSNCTCLVTIFFWQQMEYSGLLFKVNTHFYVIRKLSAPHYIKKDTRKSIKQINF